jgi:hypothetical protein
MFLAFNVSTAFTDGFLVSLVVFLLAASVSYGTSRTSNPGVSDLLKKLWKQIFVPKNVELRTGESSDDAVEKMVFRAEWNTRPRFETSEVGLFVGREELLSRLSSHFSAKNGGTILISGVRGVGKTALVDRALVDARTGLSDCYWEDAAEYLLDRATNPWHPIDLLTLRTLLKIGESVEPNPSERLDKEGKTPGKLKRGAREYAERPARRFWTRLNPVGQRIRAMHDASRWQLFVLKFNASDISGALAEPGQEHSGKPRIDPEKLLRSLIRKLYLACHPSSSTEQAGVLRRRLSNKKDRQAFFESLESAFNKSVSKSYKELVSNSLNAFIKNSESRFSERKIDVVRVILGVMVLAGFYGGAQWALGLLKSWWPLFQSVWPAWSSSIVGLAAGGIGLYLTWTTTRKRVREKGFDSARQSQFSYEYDYSLERMQRDLETLLTRLQPNAVKFHPYQCFLRSAVIFDELDKLENAEQQLDDVITHFKNFFTLSNAVFVFLTDHEFYEHLNQEEVSARLERHYSPQHTFFTEKIYLRKPKFNLFQEAFYRFTEPHWLERRAASVPSDPALIDYLFSTKGAADVSMLVTLLPLGSLIHLYVNRSKHSEIKRTSIESAFKRKEGEKNALALAHIWVSQAESRVDSAEIDRTKDMFISAGGRENSEAISYLYFCKDYLGDDAQNVAKWYENLGKPSVANYQSVKGIPFGLGDLAQSLCFQTRNHYFDLYQLVYDYVTDYQRGAPVVSFEEKLFTLKTRLASRYQRLVEIAFEGAKEDKPSREYFNGLLMESLYAVFDSRGSGGRVTVIDVLFRANDNHATQADYTQSAVNGDIVPYGADDVERINKAITHLLLLAFEHKAVSSPSADFDTLLKAGKLNWPAIKKLQFEWSDDVQSIIKVRGLKEDHEDELIRFWKNNQPALEALESELTGLWENIKAPDDWEKLRIAIDELRSKAESVRLRTIKISEADALSLKSGVLTSEGRRALVIKTILDRIRMEDDSYVVEKSTGDTSQPPELATRKGQFELDTGLMLTALISPRDTDCYLYFIAGPAPKSFDESAATLLNEHEYLLCYDWAEVQYDRPRVSFYYPPPTSPSVRKLFEDYRRIATEERLRRIDAVLMKDYSDVTLAQRAGVEAIGFIGSGSNFQVRLSNPAISSAIQLLHQTGRDLIELGAAAWEKYGIEQSDSGKQAVEKLAKYVATTVRSTKDPRFNLEVAIAEGLKDLAEETSAFNSSKWISSLVSSPLILAPKVYQGVIKQLIKEPLDQLHKEPGWREAVEPQLLGWLTLEIFDIVGDNATSLSTSTAWADELEGRRRVLRKIPRQPPQPGLKASKRAKKPLIKHRK